MLVSRSQSGVKEERRKVPGRRRRLDWAGLKDGQDLDRQEHRRGQSCSNLDENDVCCGKSEGPCWSQDNMMDGEVQKDWQEIQGAVLKQRALSWFSARRVQQVAPKLHICGSLTRPAMLEFLGVGPGISMSFSDDSEVFPPFHLLPGKNLCSWQWRVAASSEDQLGNNTESREGRRESSQATGQNQVRGQEVISGEGTSRG